MSLCCTISCANTLSVTNLDDLAANIRYKIVSIVGAEYSFMDYRLRCDLIERTMYWLKAEL
jgi:hypothetical protein